MSSGKVALGVLAGVAVGAIAGLLFAPEKGSDTRKKMMGMGEDYYEELKEKFESFMNSMTEKLETAQDEAGNMISKGKSKYEEAKS
jgi:gas vesicle protein